MQILADAMGLGKTVMTISLILARPGKGTAEIENGDKNECIKASQRPRGGTLIVCPMALLSQWKVGLLKIQDYIECTFFVFHL